MTDLPGSGPASESAVPRNGFQMAAAAPVTDSDSRRLTAALFAGGIATFAELYAVQAVLPALAGNGS